MDFAQPASLGLICLMILMQAIFTAKGVPASALSYNYRICLFVETNCPHVFTRMWQAVWDQWQPWRGLSAMVCHMDRARWWEGGLYMLANTLGLQFSSLLESQIGSLKYLKALYMIVILTVWTVILFCRGIIRISRGVRRMEQTRRLIRSPWQVRGLSCAIIGLLSMLPLVRPIYSVSGMHMSTLTFAALYISLVIWVMPRANLLVDIFAAGVGMLHGLVLTNRNLFANGEGARRGVAKKKGYFDWFSDYLFFSLVGWTAVAFILSIKMHSGLDIPWIFIETDNRWTDVVEAPVRTEFVDGRVEFHPLPPEQNNSNRQEENNDLLAEDGGDDEGIALL
eukprot:jgi/Bigna1/72269/fgenesh1_pg.19_\